MSTDPIIVCESLIKVYTIAGLEVQALQGLDLTVQPGELMGIVGASGSGKSTLLNILGGLDRPTAGRVWVDQQNLLKISDQAMNRYRRQTVGFVWQQATRNLVPYLTALENVQLPMTLAGDMGRSARARAEGLLQLVGLAARQHHHVAELSGGEQQRVAIAVALVNQPKLLLADEPTGEVDNATAKVIYGIFRDLNRELGLTTLIVSHDAGIAQYVNRVIAVRDGKLATEKVRRTSSADADPGVDTHVEWVVLDSAGRLQIPREYLQRFDIQRRAELEVTADGILIRPVTHPDEPATATKAHTAREETSVKRTHWWQRWKK
ncbi:Lipoprotein-releasing system ATP-binding protein LolD [Thermoflexales bacterium]|nr:Lipoprotein-releasing system ATP-binding protein LolD [Thermoflexales bacterium]